MYLILWIKNKILLCISVIFLVSKISIEEPIVKWLRVGKYGRRRDGK